MHILSLEQSLTYLVFLGFCPVPDWVFNPVFLPLAAGGVDTTAIEVEAMPVTVVAAIAATLDPEATDRVIPDVPVPLVLLPLFSYKI